MQVRGSSKAAVKPSKIICHPDVTRMERNKVTLGMPGRLLLAREVSAARPALCPRYGCWRDPRRVRHRGSAGRCSNLADIRAAQRWRRSGCGYTPSAAQQIGAATEPARDERGELDLQSSAMPTSEVSCHATERAAGPLVLRGAG